MWHFHSDEGQGPVTRVLMTTSGFFVGTDLKATDGHVGVLPLE
jgi:hypothetical protein